MQEVLNGPGDRAPNLSLPQTAFSSPSPLISSTLVSMVLMYTLAVFVCFTCLVTTGPSFQLEKSCRLIFVEDVLKMEESQQLVHYDKLECRRD